MFSLFDSRNRLIVSGKMQPTVVVAPVGQPGQHRSAPGRLAEIHAETGKVTIRYRGVNNSAALSLIWRFDQNGIWIDPVVYEASGAEDVVSLHYFGTPAATLYSTYLIVPGVSAGSSASPIMMAPVIPDEDLCLGHGSGTEPFQGWGLPVHYLCGFSAARSGSENRFTEGRSDAFACGLAELPAGDVNLKLEKHKSSLWIDYRSDLWKHMRGPGPISLGPTLCWSVAPDYYSAIAGYYMALVNAGFVHPTQPSAKKTATALAPQFCTWGSQLFRSKTGTHLDDAYLTEIYRELKTSGMKTGLFSIDDKWESAYGTLEHAADRLPHFEQFLDQLRADGYRVGIWAALMRCENPGDLGLTMEHMLKKPDGQPLAKNDAEGRPRYYFLDFTQPEVADVLADRARKFMRRYKPDLVKFDFGYELPAVGIAAPKDKKWCGERLMSKGLDIAFKAMREVNPDLVVMYYQLSPLYLDYIDLHSLDDLWVVAGEYDVDANRRLFFSSLLGRLGVPSYGSTGYDWGSAPNIWFDSSALGTIGTLNDFTADEQGGRCTPELAAKFNGLTHVLRPSVKFEALPLDYIPEAATLGAHARTWARFEAGRLVLLAYRPPAPGDPQPFAVHTDDPRVKDAIHSGVPVVVASRTAEDIAIAGNLAVVPYGGGEITLRRRQGKKASIRSHYFGGTTTESQAVIEKNELRFTARTAGATGTPLEWIEVSIS